MILYAEVAALLKKIHFDISLSTLIDGEYSASFRERQYAECVAIKDGNLLIAARFKQPGEFKIIGLDVYYDGTLLSTFSREIMCKDEFPIEYRIN